MALLVLDEQLERRQLIDGLRARGIGVAGLGDFGLTGRRDPDVLRETDGICSDAWVFVTVDLTIVDEHPGFHWSDYAIAWIAVPQHLMGAAFEAGKVDIVHRHAHEIVTQRRGMHRTYTVSQGFKPRPRPRPPAAPPT